MPAAVDNLANFEAIAHDGVDGGAPLKIGGRARTSAPSAVSASNDRVNAYLDPHGRLMTRAGHQASATDSWSATSVPAANAQATATKAAGGTGVRHVCTGVSAAITAGTGAAAVQLAVNLINGASAGTAYLWRSVIASPATAGATTTINLSNLWIVGSANTAMTLEFSAAGGLVTNESVTLVGVSVTE